MPPLPLEILPPPYDGQHKTLSADETEVLKKAFSDEIFGLRMLLDEVTKTGQADLQMVYAVFSVSEGQRDRACKMLGVEMESAAQREARHSQLRKANGLIRELESQLGQGATPEACTEFLRGLTAKMDYWWDVHGFGYIREMRFNRWGSMEVEFSCSLVGDYVLTGSTTPASDRELKKTWLQSLSEQGYVVQPSERGSDASLVDCDQTRQTLQKLFSSHFAHARITSTENHYERGTARMRGVTVLFQNLPEVHALPTRPADAG